MWPYLSPSSSRPFNSYTASSASRGLSNSYSEREIKGTLTFGLFWREKMAARRIGLVTIKSNTKTYSVNF